MEEPTHTTHPAGPAVSRRSFLRLLGASLALAGASGCLPRADDRIVPYVQSPEYLVPGKPLFFTTAMELGGYGTGLLIESHEGRPTKIEGNPDHPASLGATDIFAQASVLTLYDPERSQSVSAQGRSRARQEFSHALGTALEAQHRSGGTGLRILTRTVSSPTLAAQLSDVLAAFPNARWHQYEPVNRDHALAGAMLAFGQPAEARYRFDRADVVLSLDCDFLASAPGNLRYTRDFTDRRRLWETTSDAAAMNRLYAIEATPSLTGTMADHCWPVRASDIEGVTRQMAAATGLPIDAGRNHAPRSLPDGWLDALTTDLQSHRGRSLVLAGERQPPVVHALAHAMNDALGNVGETVEYTQPVAAEPVDEAASLTQLVDDMDAGVVEVLVILGGNPVYNAPSDFGFADALGRVPFSVHLGLYEDETSAATTWHVPQAHYLETWSDTRAFDGTASIIQPLILPLYGGVSEHELLAEMAGQPDVSAYDIVRDHWRDGRSDSEFDQFWREVLHAGVVPDTAFAPRPLPVRPVEQWRTPASIAPQGGSLEAVFEPDPHIYDGRFANNGWLQEVPKPLTKITWENAALLSPTTADRLDLANEDEVELQYRGQSLRAPVWVLPGHPDDAVTLPLGYGRSRAGDIGNDIGFDAYSLRVSDAPWFDGGLELRKTGRKRSLAVTQEHHQMEDDRSVRAATIEEYRAEPDFARDLPPAERPNTSLYPGFEYPDRAWGMAIDLTACIGCNACVVACQAENNIPIVGKDEVRRGREMHWLRVDAYRDDDAAGSTAFEPVPCMHCEQAPCEVVCPVNATVHSDEGLNDMVYNRCIGTRYCSNNCPYKVRRFNFIEFSDFEEESLKALRNPDVTVRSRGVMEKCTYCVQRISAARIQADAEDRPIRDGEIRTACQQVCPAQAIVFGNINDRDSRVSEMKASPLNYALLAELNTRPRTTYLARVRNLHPDLG